jgi:hypothetical protein
MIEFFREFFYTAYLVITDPQALLIAFVLLLLVVMTVTMILKMSLALARGIILGFNYVVVLNDPSDVRMRKIWKEREEKKATKRAG